MHEHSGTVDSRSSARPLPPAANDSVAAAETHRFTFTGSGREYFRIWVVNLLLTVVSLGICSAWAKVRRLQYFDRNTSLAGAVFDFRGDPKAITVNAVLTIVTLGLYRPFAVVRVYRFRLAHLALYSAGSFEQVVAGAARKRRGAAGDGVADFLGMDLSW